MDRNRRKKEFHEIRIKGHLAPSWSETFDGMQLTLTRRGETLITGAVADQAASHGLLARIRDLNLTLISVIRVNRSRGLKRTSHFRCSRSIFFSWSYFDVEPNNFIPQRLTGRLSK